MIKTILEPQYDLTIQKCIGIITDENFIKAIRSFYEENPTTNLIWDFSEASLSITSNLFIKKISDLVKTLSGKSERTGKSAVIADGDLEFGLSRMFQMLTENNNLSFKIKICRTEEEARKWILSEE